MKKDYEYPVGPILLGFFIFVVCGSGLLPAPSLDLTISSNFPNFAKRANRSARVAWIDAVLEPPPSPAPPPSLPTPQPANVILVNLSNIPNWSVFTRQEAV